MFVEMEELATSALPERVGPAMMGFGDGHHRCPGAYIALQENIGFLQRRL